MTYGKNAEREGCWQNNREGDKETLTLKTSRYPELEKYSGGNR
jgi:hypothetical protein